MVVRTEVIKMHMNNEMKDKTMEQLKELGMSEDKIDDMMLWGASKMMYGMAKMMMSMKENGMSETESKEMMKKMMAKAMETDMSEMMKEMKDDEWSK